MSSQQAEEEEKHVLGKPTAWEKPSNKICGQVGEVETSSQATGRNRRLGGVGYSTSQGGAGPLCEKHG